ncbi:MAG: RdgB/HAM1 family non-canonical purine NTP pyrophosphatase [Bacillota bacterium]
MKLVLATSNKGKLREFLRLFAELMPDLPLSLTLGSEEGLSPVEETGTTFAENARIKAISAASQSGKMCLAEDSGLEVDFLYGAPGVKSHRFSESGSDHDNNLLLLEKMKGVREPQRTARYRAAICIASPRGIVAEGLGTVEGYVTTELRGSGGFGYDPLFFCPELGKTMGEASAAEKDSVSHRRRAMEVIVRNLRAAALAEEGLV